MAGGGKKGGGTYKHIQYRRTVKQDTSPIIMKYKASASMLLDEINLFCSNTGNRSINSTVYVTEISTGKQIGKKVTFLAPSLFASVKVSGFKASLQRGREYNINIGHIDDNIDSLIVGPTQVITFRNIIELAGYQVTDPIWRVESSEGSGKYFSLGGWQSYKESGSFERTLDVGVTAASLKQDGLFFISDIIPSNTKMNIDLYFTDDDLISQEQTTSNWTFYVTGATDGMSIPKHRYWRVVISMFSNKTRDFTPEVADFSIEYRPEPKTFGTIVDTKITSKAGYFVKASIPWGSNSSLEIKNKGEKNLSSFNIQASKVNPKFQTTISGGFTASIAEDDYSNNVFDKNLSARICQIRIGYRGVDSRVLLYKARVSDASYKKGGFTLNAIDSYEEFKAKIPSSKAALTWSGATNYIAGNKAVFFGGLYSAITNNINKQPDISPLDWNAVGGAWADIIYDETTSSGGGKWHLADILLDIVKNQVNIHTSKIDSNSFAVVKALIPDVIGTLYLRKPVTAKQIIDEAAWLLQSHIVVRNGKIALIKEPDVSESNDIIDINPSDILENSLTYRNGWKDIKNQCIILTAFNNSAVDNAESFGDGEVVVDADSVAEFDTVTTDVFKDKFNIDTTILQSRASIYVNKWKRGRGVISLSVDISKIDIEVLNVVSIESKQLPKYTRYKKTGIVLSKDVDWLKQNIKLVVMEIK